MNYIAKINISRVMMLFCFSIWLLKEALRVDRNDASRRVSLLRSLITVKEWEPGHTRVFLLNSPLGYQSSAYKLMYEKTRWEHIVLRIDRRYNLQV